MTTRTPSSPLAYLISPALTLLLLGIPFALARTGEEALLCADGLSRVGLILLVETGIVLLAALGLNLAGDRLPPVMGSLRKHVWGLVGIMALVTLPYLIAWQTDSSVCTRGRAFFWQSIFIEIFILSIMALSYNLLFGFAGILSFGHAAFFGVGAYMVGILTVHLSLSWPLAILTTMLIGILIALFKGFVGLRIKGLYFALFTLAFAEVLFILSANRLMVNITGAEDGFTYPVPDIVNTTQNRLFFYYLVLVLLVACYLLVQRLMDSPTGRALAAIRENEDRARMIGFQTINYKLIALVVSGFMATGAGILRGIANKGASPNVLGAGVTIDALLKTIIGGAGTFMGPVVGAFGLNLTEHALRDTEIMIGATTVDIGKYWALILGILFIVTVLLFPQGLVGTWMKNRDRLLDRFRPGKPDTST